MSAYAGTVVDPTAGVTLYRKRIICPRCGVVKGTTFTGARPGICQDCRVSLTREERAAWGGA